MLMRLSLSLRATFVALLLLCTMHVSAALILPLPTAQRSFTIKQQALTSNHATALNMRLPRLSNEATKDPNSQRQAQQSLWKRLKSKLSLKRTTNTHKSPSSSRQSSKKASTVSSTTTLQPLRRSIYMLAATMIGLLIGKPAWAGGGGFGSSAARSAVPLER
jgi:hypothetical protein